MTTAKAAKKREKQKLLTPLYRLRTVIFTAVLPSRRVTEPQPPQDEASMFSCKIGEETRGRQTEDVSHPRWVLQLNAAYAIELHAKTAIGSPQPPRLLQAKSKPALVLNAMKS